MRLCLHTRPAGTPRGGEQGRLEGLGLQSLLVSPPWGLSTAPGRLTQSIFLSFTEPWATGHRSMPEVRSPTKEQIFRNVLRFEIMTILASIQRAPDSTSVLFLYLFIVYQDRVYRFSPCSTWLGTPASASNYRCVPPCSVPPCSVPPCSGGVTAHRGPVSRLSLLPLPCS